MTAAVLSNVAHPSLRCKVATDNMLQIIEAHSNWPVYADVFEHPPPQLASRHPIWSDITSVDNRAVERTGHWLLWSATLLLLTLLPNSQLSISLIIHRLWWTVSGHVVLTCTNGVSFNHLLVIVSPLTKFEGGLNLLHYGDDDAVRWL